MIRVLTDTTDIPITQIGEMAGICWGADTSDHKKNFKRGIDCIQSNHGRTLEFPQVYLEISGYSARVIRELYTHIGGAPTRLQESTRYIKEGNFKYVVPPSVTKDENAFHVYESCMNAIKICMSQLETLGIPNEDISMMLPLGMETRIVIRTNLRNLIDMSHQRCCKRAYWEFQQLMIELKRALSFYSDEWKILIEKMSIFVPKCIVLGHCPEKNGCANSIKAVRKEFDFSKYLETMDYNDITLKSSISNKELVLVEE